jgi:succinate dehydrogenase / fumarate reductase membrane anchor subunit
MTTPGTRHPDMRTADMRTPLGRVRGYGSAKSGTGHFIAQRLTALANIPLTIAAVLIVISLIGHNHAAVVQILGSSPVAIGMQVIIEDYVHDDAAKYPLLIFNAFFAAVVGFSSIYALLKLSFGV